MTGIRGARPLGSDYNDDPNADLLVMIAAPDDLDGPDPYEIARQAKAAQKDTPSIWFINLPDHNPSEYPELKVCMNEIIDCQR